MRRRLLTAGWIVAWCTLVYKPTPTTNASVETSAESTDSRAAETTGDPEATILAAFRQASENKDVEQMLQLYCFDGVDAEMREVVRGNVRDELLHPVTDLQIVDAPPGKHGPRVEGGIHWKPNLTVVKVLKAKFAPAAPGEGFSITEADYALGIQNGQYRIVMSVRE